MKKTKTFYLVSVLAVSVLLLSTANAGAVSEEARRHMDRGLAAVEMAKTPDDYERAISEFEKARSLAPDWADVYYNLALIQEKAGKYGDAVVNFKKYLRLAPNSNEAAEVKSLINKLEFKAEQEITKEVALDIFGSLSDSTKWRFIGKSSAYRNWVKGFRRDRDRIFITYICDIQRGTTSNFGRELEDETLTLKYIMSFFNFCGKDCDVGAQYIFEIVSKNKVQVKAIELWPKIGPIEQETKYYTFEYIRI